MKDCAKCVHGLFGGEADTAGRKIGQCRYNPPSVVVVSIKEIQHANDGVLLARSNPPPVVTEREIVTGAFPVVFEGMFCRQFANVSAAHVLSGADIRGEHLE